MGVYLLSHELHRKQLVTAHKQVFNKVFWPRMIGTTVNTTAVGV